MILLILLSVTLVIIVTLIVGAPYLPSKHQHLKDAFAIVKVKPGQVFIDLGSGDGKVLIAAAERQAQVIGYEINPFLVFLSKWRTFKYRSKIQIKMTNFWQQDLSQADIIYVFAINKVMDRLYSKLQNEINKPIKVISIGYKFSNLTPEKSRGEVYLYSIKPLQSKG